MCFLVDPNPVGRSLYCCPDGGQVNIGFTLSGGDQSVLFPIIGGLGALLAKTIKESEIIAYPDLEPESVRRLVVKDFPAIVATDAYGEDIYHR